MNVTGIIAEYNPFHNGHLYHLTQARRETEADFLVVLLSGDFVQRGEPAILDKWTRTQMALLCGADLVLELPAFAATGSAEYFARGAISLFSASNLIRFLSFGSESGDLASLSRAASFFAHEPASYQKMLRQELKKGLSFPIARQNAFSSWQQQTENHFPLAPVQTQDSKKTDDLSVLLSFPNNLLAIEYLKALYRLKSPILPHTLTRVGSGYHDVSFVGQFGSASGIRNAISSSGTLDSVKSQLPDGVFDLWQTSWAQSSPIGLEDFSSLLHYRLLSFSERFELSDFYDLSPDLADRIFRIRQSYTTFSEFAMLLKTRQLTYTRVSRSLIHLLLNMKQKTADAFFENAAAYFRILGFRKSATPLLAALKKKSDLPIITKLADARQLLNASALSVLHQDLYNSAVYHAAVAQKYPGHIYNEYRRSPIIQ